MAETDNITSISTLFEKLHTWAEHHVWTTSTFIELVLIVVAFAVAGVLAPALRERATRAIEASKLPLRTKLIAKHSRRLILPTLSLFFIFVTSKIAGAEIFAVDTSVLDAVMKVLQAWIAIRLCLQFVQNSVMRNILFWTIWLIAALSIFGVLQPAMDTLDTVSFTTGTLRISALEVIKSILLLMILLYIALFISTFFERKVLKSKNLTRSSQVLAVKIIRMALVVVAVIIGVTSSGIDLSIFAVFSGAVGLGIGFGLQRGASNLFSGLLLLMDQSIKPGDIIELEAQGTFGWVNKMAARYTEIVTRDNKSYLIPNEDFITQRVINWSYGDRLIRLEVNFGVHYDSNPHDVIRIAVEATKNLGGRVVPSPAPVCALKEFGESSLNFKLHFWIGDAEQGLSNIKSDVMLALWDAFKANNIEIPYPHREVHMHQHSG